jgi:Domain of unknown function (DUF4976)
MPPPEAMAWVFLLNFHRFAIKKSQNTEGGFFKKPIYYHYYEPNHQVPPHLGIKTKQYKWMYFCDKASEWEFYDLEHDPQEMYNGIDDKKYAPTIAKLKVQLNQLVEKYDDKEAKDILRKVK